MFFDSGDYKPLPQPLGATMDGYEGFVNPNNLDHFRFCGKKKGLLEQDEPAHIGFGKSTLENHINPAYKQALKKIRPFYQTSCDRFNSERLVEDKEDYRLNNDIKARRLH
ncbi:uncharacterized protein [Centruroides vittatus]|uniref:uncharacterized protein n=1 Tax=Centruroides vittatus TaxID=120091 RepID=UPI003510194D